MDWMAIIGAVAPTAARMLGGPLAGMAVDALGSALGLSSATKDSIAKAVSQSNLTGDQIAAMKAADNDLQAKLKALDIDLDRIYADDRKSARDMQISTRSNTPHILAVVLVAGFFGLLLLMAFHALPDGNTTLLNIMFGTLSASFGSVMNFFFGSSRASDAKTDIIATMATAPGKK